MSAITKVSEITAQSIAEYLRLAEPANEMDYLNTIKGVAVDYILKYTGIESAEELDKYQDIVIVVYVLCQDMYDTRALYVDNSNVNRVVDSILGMHQRNLL